jgi:hypothetical protein
VTSWFIRCSGPDAVSGGTGTCGGQHSLDAF